MRDDDDNMALLPHQPTVARVHPPTGHQPTHRCNGNPAPRHGTQNKCTVCGEYRNGWFDPVSGLEMLVPTGKVSESDKALARRAASRIVNVLDTQQPSPPWPFITLSGLIESTLTTVRKEEREATWTKSLNMARVTATSTGMPELWALYEAMKRESEKGASDVKNSGHIA